MNRIKELRKEKRITQLQLADALGICKSSMSLYENGRRLPDINLINKICDVLGCSSDYLLGRTTSPYPSLTEHDADILEAFHAADPTVQDAL